MCFMVDSCAFGAVPYLLVNPFPLSQKCLLSGVCTRQWIFDKRKFTWNSSEFPPGGLKLLVCFHSSGVDYRGTPGKVIISEKKNVTFHSINFAHFINT